MKMTYELFIFAAKLPFERVGTGWRSMRDSCVAAKMIEPQIKHDEHMSKLALFRTSAAAAFRSSGECTNAATDTKTAAATTGDSSAAR